MMLTNDPCTGLDDAMVTMDHHIYGSQPFPDRPIGFSGAQLYQMREVFGERVALVFIEQGSVNELRHTVKPFKSSMLGVYDDAPYMRDCGDEAAWHLVGVCSIAEYRAKRSLLDLLRVDPLDLRKVAFVYKAVQGVRPGFFGEYPILTGSTEFLAVSHLGTQQPSVLVQLCAEQIRIETCPVHQISPQRLVAVGVRESLYAIR